MNPEISAISEEHDVYRFTLSKINVSLANAFRRTILNDIPTVVFEEDKIDIIRNTGRLHNEILKHRLSCIPIHTKDLQQLPGNYILELDVKNETDAILYLTTADFRIKNKENGNYVTESETRVIFPANAQTQDHIIFSRLAPKIGDTIPAEELSLTADFSVKTVAYSSAYNVVSKCSYGNTPDLETASEAWRKIEVQMRSEELSSTEIDFQKRNFYLTDAQRYFKENSFDFVIQTVGVFENREILKKAALVLQSKFHEFIQSIESDIVPIIMAETASENMYDITLENEDYTMGKVIEYFLYEKYYIGDDKVLNFCGFKKLHPHNTSSFIRLGYLEPTEKNMVRQHLKTACVDAEDIFTKIYKMF